ncbi:unnamed protein product [Adineta ricciae]|uniref:Uncharacterized protein n=1 Tax=Adineta ricciae TaxID=249248 RepID=A0A814LYA5_ADIRI|nr:unnamed protein product [Adineta ricciae]CAF1071416.1 unnamed protein product [Adineta ricciae]
MNRSWLHSSFILLLLIAVPSARTDDGQNALNLLNTGGRNGTTENVTIHTTSTTTITTTTTTGNPTTLSTKSTNNDINHTTTTATINMTTPISVLELTAISIKELFDNATNPARLVDRLDNVTIDDAIDDAEELLDQLTLLDNVSASEIQDLTQLFNLAKGLQMLKPYFTDLSMENMLLPIKNLSNLRRIKSNIRTLGITNPNFKHLLNSILTNLTDAVKGSTNNSTQSNDASSLEQIQKILNAKRHVWTSKDGISYTIDVHEENAIGKGKYLFDEVPFDDYSSVTCIYYNTNNEEFRSARSKTKPAFCDVLDTDLADIDKLEMRVYGMSSPPNITSITFDGVYVPQKHILRGITPFFLPDSSRDRYDDRRLPPRKWPEPLYRPSHIIPGYYPRSPPAAQAYYVQPPVQTVRYVQQPAVESIRASLLPTATCNQPRSLSVNGNSPYVIAQDNIWQINVNQIYGTSIPVNSVQVNTQGDVANGNVLLALLDSNQQGISYSALMSNGIPVTFQNLPSTRVAYLQLEFPIGTRTDLYSVNLIICAQSNALPVSSSRIQNLFIPSLSPYTTNDDNNNDQVLLNSIMPQREYQPVPSVGYSALKNPSGLPSQQSTSDQNLLSKYLGSANQYQPVYQQLDPSSFQQSPPDGNAQSNQQMPFYSSLPGQSYQNPRSSQRMLLSVGEQQPLEQLDDQSASSFDDEQENQASESTVLTQPKQQFNQVYQQAAPWIYGPGQTDKDGSNNQPSDASSYGLQQNGQIQSQPYTQNYQPDPSSYYSQDTSGQSGQLGSLDIPYGTYAAPNGRAPLPVPGANNRKPNNVLVYGKRPPFDQYNDDQSGPHPPNQGSRVPPIKLRYTDEQAPCVLYYIRSGSRRIISNSTDDESITWIVQVPPKYGYGSIPTLVSAQNIDFDQLAVNYLNPDQSPAQLANGSALEFISAPDANDISTFPDDTFVHMLEVVVDGVTSPASQSSLEIRLLVCFKPLSSSQFDQSQLTGNQNQQPPPQFQRPPPPFQQSPLKPPPPWQSQYDQSKFQSQQPWQSNSRTPQSPNKPTLQSTNTASASSRNPSATQSYCNCNCQCPANAVEPVIQGANVVYQYLPAVVQQPQQQRGRRQRRQADAASSEFIMREN